MPHVSSGGGGDDLGSTDEVKVFKDEGEDEKRSSENLTEEKSSLIDLTESEEKSGSLPGQSYSSSKNASRSDHSPVFGEYYYPLLSLIVVNCLIIAADVLKGM
ncbi:Protein pangolin [Blattella germanica]|nr:Protein pangolin [Blattella germanica]